MSSKGNIKVNANIFPIIKNGCIPTRTFLRELVVNSCDAITKILSSNQSERSYDEKPRISKM